MHKAVDEMADRETFHGYGPEQGYDFLREAIAKNDYQARGCDIAADEIFISDGSKCDCGNILDIFGPATTTIAVTDPVYPVYVDTNVMAGHTGHAERKRRIRRPRLPPRDRREQFHARPSQTAKSISSISATPNNPTGAVPRASGSPQWVDYAQSNNAVILFDAAYEAYIPIPPSRTRSTKSPGARSARSSSAASAKPPASPACAAPSPSSPKP